MRDVDPHGQVGLRAASARPGDADVVHRAQPEPHHDPSDVVEGKARGLRQAAMTEVRSPVLLQKFRHDFVGLWRTRAAAEMDEHAVPEVDVLAGRDRGGAAGTDGILNRGRIVKSTVRLVGLALRDPAREVLHAARGPGHRVAREDRPVARDAAGIRLWRPRDAHRSMEPPTPHARTPSRGAASPRGTRRARGGGPPTPRTTSGSRSAFGPPVEMPMATTRVAATRARGAAFGGRFCSLAAAGNSGANPPMPAWAATLIFPISSAAISSICAWAASRGLATKSNAPSAKALNVAEAPAVECELTMMTGSL